MTTLHYTAELAHRQAALRGEAEVARQARRSRRRFPGPRHGSEQRASLAGPPGLAVPSL
jgi:hypothetical protein